MISQVGMREGGDSGGKLDQTMASQVEVGERGASEERQIKPLPVRGQRSGVEEGGSRWKARPDHN